MGSVPAMPRGFSPLVQTWVLQAIPHRPLQLASQEGPDFARAYTITAL